MSDFTKNPFVEVHFDAHVWVGWPLILDQVRSSIAQISKGKIIVVVEVYPGAFAEEIVKEFATALRPDTLLIAEHLFEDVRKIREMVYPDVTDDRLFGRLSRLDIDAFFDPKKVADARSTIAARKHGVIMIIGTGAATIPESYDLLIYADMARWEIQLRMRRHEVCNLGVANRDVDDWMLLYKQGYFVDWRVCDRLKRKLIVKWDYVLDTNNRDEPKLVEGEAVREGLRQASLRPFSVVPFFDPGPWGGQWMKDLFDLDPSTENYAWCFNCVPEENSLLLRFGAHTIEIPSIDLVFFRPTELLGDHIRRQFGEEFPIRFDYLDTMNGGNLSLQVHPLTGYIRETFGMEYTQDESYYIMDAKPGAVVHLGLKDRVSPDEMIADLQRAQTGARSFDAGKFIQTWPVKKHDHFLIPAGTVHCSGKNSVVLEISATPYIFTFKLWDWGRLGLDGKPRPINIEHGRRVIQWDRTPGWTRRNLINRVEKIAEGNGWIEERTGLHEKEFIETRRHWFTGTVLHNTNGSVNVLNLVDGQEVIVESPTSAFEPFVVHYAETFIVPAAVGQYTIKPFGKSNGRRCATIKAFVRMDSQS